MHIQFWEKAITGRPEDCWEWTATKDKDGYGRFRANGIFGMAHRFAYELLVAPIPEGLTIDHLCRNPACVNPAHLEPVTIRENQLRGNINQNAGKAYCIHGHPFDLINTLYLPTGGRRCRECRRASWRQWHSRTKRSLPPD